MYKKEDMALSAHQHTRKDLSLVEGHATSKIQDLSRALQISMHCLLPLAEHSSRMLLFTLHSLYPSTCSAHYEYLPNAQGASTAMGELEWRRGEKTLKNNTETHAGLQKALYTSPEQLCRSCATR